jgi:SAM-dependent methyltransferase
MRKDYVPVGESAGVDETDFVERYWTNVWKNHDRPPDLSALERREEYRIIRPFLSRLPAGSRLLDGGCGLGEWTVLFAQQGFDTVGLDLSVEVVEKLNRSFPTHQFHRADIRQTGFPDQSFDGYFSWGAFEHFENGLGDCLDEAHRILRPGGWLFISIPFDNWRHILRDAGRLERWDEGFDPHKGYTQAHRFYQWRLTRPELRRELELRGFGVESVTPISKLQGVGRMLQYGLPVVRKDSRAYYAIRRGLAAVLPASFVSHMLLAVAQRR